MLNRERNPCERVVREEKPFEDICLNKLSSARPGWAFQGLSTIVRPLATYAQAVEIHLHYKHKLLQNPRLAQSLSSAIRPAALNHWQMARSSHKPPKSL